MNFKEGEIIEIQEKEYIVYSVIKEENTNYYYLMSNFKPLEIKFAKSVEETNNDELILINEQQEKLKVFDLFKKRFND